MHGAADAALTAKRTEAAEAVRVCADAARAACACADAARAACACADAARSVAVDALAAHQAIIRHATANGAQLRSVDMRVGTRASAVAALQHAGRGAAHIAASRAPATLTKRLRPRGGK